ncbi:MAG: ParB/RepB/Spo0J family partition protein [Neisseria sp.]|nr:ParB/RepB/Spo0J family partition protein [Neisseria sp.]
MSRKSKGLGRGLDSLLASGIDNVTSGDRLSVLPIDSITPGRYQPRSQMDDESLQELADSIRVQGVIQPVIVRESGLDGYELVAGERRWRAAQLAELNEIPAVIKSISDENALAMGLIENIQRQNLNPIEEAQGLKRLVEEFGLTHERVAEAVGRSRSSISNSLRLLNLPEPVQDLLYARRLEMGHARALITLPVIEQIALAQSAVKNGWSVREVERRATQKPAKPPRAASADADIQRLEQRLAEFLGMDVSVRCGARGRGKITFAFASLDELDYLLRKLDYRDE